MPTLKCRLIETEPESYWGAEPGDMWFAPRLVDPERSSEAPDFLGDRYFRDWAGKRPPIIVMLPNGAGRFCVDQRATDGSREGWEVTGEAPNLTVKPSINAGSRFHGWLTDGEFTW